jgi:hypothetical protein
MNVRGAIMQAANNNGDADLIVQPGDADGTVCVVGRPGSAQRRFVVAVMAISTADEMLADGDIGGGIIAYRKAIDICPPCPQRADFQLLLGGILFEQGDAAAAAIEIQAALAAGCTYPYEAQRRLAFAYAAQGDFTAARVAMTQSLEAGEDEAFARQAMVTFDLASGGVEAALQMAATYPTGTDAQAEYRCRLALARAELQRLAGNIPAALAEIELAAELARQDALDAELALWFAALDRHFGLKELRPDVAAAFAAEPDHWATLAWQILCGHGARADLEHHLEGMVGTQRAENLAIFDRLAGLAAEDAGDHAAARAAYESARVVPFTQWCIDYHLAGVALGRLSK